MLADYPQGVAAWDNPQLESEYEYMQSVVSAVSEVVGAGRADREGAGGWEGGTVAPRAQHTLYSQCVARRCVGWLLRPPAVMSPRT